MKTSDDERNALEIARGTTGVIGVEDRLTVMPMPGSPETTARKDGDAPDATTSPAWITTKIQAQYFVDSDVKPWNVDVATTSAGVVALDGVVDSPQAKSAAVRISRETAGVTAVEDRLRVRAEGTESDDHTQDAGANDTWLTAKVRAKYFLDDRVKAFGLDVTTENGVVTLTGTVDSEMARRQAVTLARSTDGVRGVRDRLAVAGANASGARPSAAKDSTDRIASGIEDSWITTKIQSQYFLEADVKGRAIDVDTRQGLVTLTGSVTSAAEQDLAQRIARETDGVTEVVNRLKVASAP